MEPVTTKRNNWAFCFTLLMKNTMLLRLEHEGEMQTTTVRIEPRLLKFAVDALRHCNDKMEMLIGLLWLSEKCQPDLILCQCSGSL